MNSPSTASMLEHNGGPSTPVQRGSGFSGANVNVQAANMSAPTPTPVGGRAFCSPAMIRILLTPATAEVTPDEFEKMTNVIRRIESIRISDLPLRNSKQERISSNSPLSRSGEVHISFVTSYDPSHSFLSPFTVHRQVLGVLGLSTCSSNSSVEALERAPAALRQLHPNAVVHRVFGFDIGAARPQTMDLSSLENVKAEIEKAGGGSISASSSAAVGLNEDFGRAEEGGDMGEEKLTKSSLDSSANNQSNAKTDKEKSSNTSGFAGRGSTGLVIFPAVRRDLKDVRFYLKTLIPQFVADLLDGLEDFINDLQGKPLETPRETLDGAMATVTNNSTSMNSSSSSSGKTLGSAASTAASRASALFSSFSNTDDGSSTSSSSRKVSRSSKNIIAPAGVGPTGTGRYAKVKADYYLLTGDLWGASKEYDSCLNLLGKERALAGGQDAVWYASALEGWAVTRVLTIRMGGLVAEKAPCTTMPLGGVKEKEKVASDFQFTGKEWSDIAEAYTLALTIYSKCLAPASYLLDTMRSVTPDTPRDYTHPLIHTSACLAYSRLLLAIWASGGWNGETFDQLLLGGVPPALSETIRPSFAVYLQHTTSSGIQRSDIAAPASLSLTNSSTNALKLLDQVHLYSSLAAIFGCVGFARKEAYAIQRLQSLVVVLIAQGVNLQKQQSSSSSEALRSGTAAYGTMHTQISSVGGGMGSESILVLALQICQTYGINVQLMPLLDMDRGHILLRASVDVKSGKRLSSPMLNRNRAAAWTMSAPSSSFGERGADWKKFLNDEEQAQQAAVSELLEDPHFGWIEQQIAILKDTISICEMLQDNHSLLFFGTLLLRDFWQHLGFEEQFKLKDGIAKIMTDQANSELDKGGDKKMTLQYWGPKDILARMELECDSTSIPKKIFFKDLPRHGESQNILDLSRRRDTRGGQKSTETGLIQDEISSFVVTLHNPLQIPLELESIRLDLQTLGNLGPTFESIERKNIILPPNALHVVRLSGRARGEGRLFVRGVFIKLPFCAERLFTFEYAQGNAEKTLWKAQSDLDDRWTRIKRVGLDARSSGSTGIGLHSSYLPKSRSRLQESLWIIPVIAKVPNIDIRPSSGLRTGSLIIHDGEERIVSFTVQNMDEMLIDHLKFTFDDDVQTDTIEILNEGQLDVVDIYELEQDLIERPFLSLVDNDDGKQSKDTKYDLKEADKNLKVEGHQTKTFSFKILGKLDVRRASIRVQFGNKSTSREIGRDYFWSRQIQFSFDVRVLPTVFLDGLELSRAEDVDMAFLQSLISKGSDTRWDVKTNNLAIVSLAVHNSLSSGEIEVCLNVQGLFTGSSKKTELITRKLPAHSSVRIHFLLPISTQKDIEQNILKPIPKLVERQFIASQVKRTPLQEREMRALFWTRQKLLARLSKSFWKQSKSRRTGMIGMTGLRLSDVNSALALYDDPVHVRIGMATTKKLQKTKELVVDSTLKVKANDFTEIHFEFENVSEFTIEDASYRFESKVDEKQIAQHVLCVSGHMHGILPPILPGETRKLFVGLCFLTRGLFQFDFSLKPTKSALINRGGTSAIDENSAISLSSLLGINANLASKGIKVHVQ